MPIGSGGLLRHPNFLKLWTGETISLFGSQITVLALPLTAVLLLQATPAEMGLLGAARYLPFLALTLFAGVWIDRRERRQLLILANVGRAVLLGAVPALAMLGLLRIEYLYLVALLLGSLTVVFDLAYQSVLPSLVDREKLVEGNSKLQLSASAAEVAGPGLGGVLVQLLTAPVALALDAASYLVSVVTLLSIPAMEPAPSTQGTARGSVWRDISEGLHMTLGNPTLRACALEAATYNLFWLVLETVFVLYVTRELGFGAGQLGVIVAAGSLGSLVGSLLAQPLANRLGIGRTIAIAMAVGCAAPALIPITEGRLAMAFLLVAYFVGGAGGTVSNIHVVSLRQSITPDRLLGRMNASYRFLAWGSIPLGALLGGVLGETIGLRPTLGVAVLGLASAALWVLLSPVTWTADLQAHTVSTQDPSIAAAT